MTKRVTLGTDVKDSKGNLPFFNLGNQMMTLALSIGGSVIVTLSIWVLTVPTESGCPFQI